MKVNLEEVFFFVDFVTYLMKSEKITHVYLISWILINEEQKKWNLQNSIVCERKKKKKWQLHSREC